MWGKNVTFTFIRPQRYTKEFIDKNDHFSMCFFDDTYKKALSYLGSVSGRNEDKIQKSGLTPYFINNIPCFKEANLVIICKKLYLQELEPKYIIENKINNTWYPNQDYHFMYISEIEKIYTNKLN